MKRWTHSRAGDTLTIHRPGRARLDVAAQTKLAIANPSKTRLAHAVRQDLWRALQTTRGFSPVVKVAPSGQTTTITAGGQIDGRISPILSAQIAALLANPQKRARWAVWAKERAT